MTLNELKKRLKALFQRKPKRRILNQKPLYESDEMDDYSFQSDIRGMNG